MGSTLGAQDGGDLWSLRRPQRAPVLGFDHERLVHRHQGRDFRLTDVSGGVVREVLA